MDASEMAAGGSAVEAGAGAARRRVNHLGQMGRGIALDSIPLTIWAMRLPLLLPVTVLVIGLGAMISFGKEDGTTKPRAPRRQHLLLVVDRAEHDFGIVGQNEELTTTFTYTNASKDPVEDIRATADCGCNRVELSDERLEPGKSGTLKVSFQTAVLSGQLQKRVRIFTRDRSLGEIIMRLKISIVRGLILDPGAVSFGDTVKGSRPTAHFGVKWYEGSCKPFEITKVEIPGHEKNFVTHVVPYKPTKGDHWRGYVIDVRFLTPPPLGMYSAHVLVRTTHPDHKRLELPLSANVIGKVWMQSRVLHFGVLEEGTSRTATLKFRPHDPKAVFGDVHAHSRSGHLAVTTRPDTFRPELGLWVLSATVPKEAKPGRLDEEIIELHTGLPGEEIVLVKVRGRVRAHR